MPEALIFTEFDANKDRVITEAEFRAGLESDWAQASKAPGFQPRRPPWSPDHLRSADVGDALLEYLKGFPGMVVGGAPARAES